MKKTAFAFIDELKANDSKYGHIKQKLKTYKSIIKINKYDIVSIRHKGLLIYELATKTNCYLISMAFNEKEISYFNELNFDFITIFCKYEDLLFNCEFD